jgi:hypothetical protein
LKPPNKIDPNDPRDGLKSPCQFGTHFVKVRTL